MKKIILLTALLCLSLMINAQTNFKWDVIDSVSKTKEQIYSDTKIFIAKTWKSAQNVIQNDDKESGNIILQCINLQQVFYPTVTNNYFYHYAVEFKMKDGKYKIIISGVYCEDVKAISKVTSSPYPPKIIPPFDVENVIGKTRGEKKAIEMMITLKTELQSIVEDYQKYMNTPSSTNNDW